MFAALTSILGKVGIEGVESNLGTAIRTAVVLIMAWAIVFMQKTQHDIGSIGRRDGGFLVLSGLATGASWLCFYKALQDGPASLVVPIDKLSILFTVVFAVVFLHEKMSKKSWIVWPCSYAERLCCCSECKNGTDIERTRIRPFHVCGRRTIS